MAAINASSVKLTIGGSDVDGLQSVSLSMSADLIDVTVKNNSGRADYISGLKSATLDFEGLVDFAHTNGVEALFTAKDGRTSIAWVVTDTSNTYSGNGIITDFSVSAPMEDAASYSGTITVKGEITKA